MCGSLFSSSILSYKGCLDLAFECVTDLGQSQTVGCSDFEFQWQCFLSPIKNYLGMTLISFSGCLIWLCPGFGFKVFSLNPGS